jgi:hypothetical protein
MAYVEAITIRVIVKKLVATVVRIFNILSDAIFKHYLQTKHFY